PEGSSSMPHKRNPITSERICGLARILRGNVQSALENVALWHERDMSHSSVERIIIPDSFSLIHYMLVKMSGLIAGLVVHRKNIEKNTRLAKGAIYSQILLIELVERGVSRGAAHQAINTASLTASRDNRSLLSVLQEDSKLAKLLEKKVFNEEAFLDELRTTSQRIIAQEK
ncbi:adenylosuccinate lyase, partial [Candidatus Bipolaricaulota bacterium]|nr:adenylosuccinate lyase [Candidatus Bipolaricaulota bacterium]